jgi:hypothetical protein
MMPATTTNALIGWCPMGCGQTLIVPASGRVICHDDTCPCPDAVSQILADREHEHRVRWDADAGFSIRHPLRERVGDELLACELHAYCADIDKGNGPPVAPGLYRATWSGERARWEWERIAA